MLYALFSLFFFHLLTEVLGFAYATQASLLPRHPAVVFIFTVGFEIVSHF